MKAKKRTIKAIKLQKSKLNNELKINEYSIWHGSTLHYIEKIFGKESYAYKAFSQFRTFDIQDTSAENYLLIKQNLLKLIDEFIDMVENDLYEKPPKANFLQNIDSALLVLIIGGVCTGCYLIGQYTSDVKNYDLKQENRKALDSLSKYRTLITSQKDSIANYKRMIYTILNEHKK